MWSGERRFKSRFVWKAFVHFEQLEEKKCCFGKLENLTLSWVFKCFPSCAESEKDILLNENASGKIPRQCEFYNVSLEFHF